MMHMNIINIEILVNGKAYTQIFTRVVWSGGIKGTSRKLDVEYVSDVLIANIGDIIEFRYKGMPLFVGRVFTASRKGETPIKSFYCYDNSIYLNKNKFIKNVYKKAPSVVLKEICGELQLPVGKVPKDEVKCTYPAIGRSGYEIVLNAYTIQHRKTKRIYSIVSNSNNIDVVEQGTISGAIISSKNDISNSSYSQSIERLVNQIVIYKTEKDKTQIIDKVDNAEDKKKYGIFQDVLEYEEDSNNIENAKEMLQSVAESASIKCLGNPLIKSGYSIGVYEPNINIVGCFLVKNDTHIFEGENHYCEIELAFENVMDKAEFDEKVKSKKKVKSNKKAKGDKK